jgi:hypothetical protein
MCARDRFARRGWGWRLGDGRCDLMSGCLSSRKQIPRFAGNDRYFQLGQEDQT